MLLMARNETSESYPYPMRLYNQSYTQSVLAAIDDKRPRGHLLELNWEAEGRQARRTESATNGYARRPSGSIAQATAAATGSAAVVDVLSATAVSDFTRTHFVAVSETASAPSAQASVVQLSSSSPLLVALSLEVNSSDVVGAVVAVLSEDDKSGVGFSTLTALDAEALVDAEVVVAEVSSDSESESDWEDSFGGSGFTAFLVDGRLILTAFSFCCKVSIPPSSNLRSRTLSFLSSFFSEAGIYR